MNLIESARLKHRVQIKWSSNFAYAIGLIATDGWLNKDKRHIGFVSKDLELVEMFKRALGVKNTITPHARGGETIKKYFGVHVGDKSFWEFLYNIGITPAKSKTIRSVAVPDKYYIDFLRGVFDGDGSFYTFWDTRWPNAFGYVFTIASASRPFLEWLLLRNTNVFGVKGIIRKGDGVYEIRYNKGDVQRIFSLIYKKKNILFLTRKYNKIKTAFLFDQGLHPERKKVKMPQ